MTPLFQFTLPHGERRAQWKKDYVDFMFQFTLPHGERPRQGGRERASSSRFNSRSRMGSDPASQAEPRFYRGFNSRSRMGSDLWLLLCWRHDVCFNSRSRMGSDPVRPKQTIRNKVSIHAPAWGATQFDQSKRFGTKFQFTLPHGERLPNVETLSIRRAVSIHAPAWGATDRRGGLQKADQVSIHAPAWGATPKGHKEARIGDVSIHAPAWGATQGRSDRGQ